MKKRENKAESKHLTAPEGSEKKYRAGVLAPAHPVVLERWRVGLSKVRFLYRGHDGRLWGVPALPKGKTPEDCITREPLNVRAWLVVRLGEMRRGWLVERVDSLRWDADSDDVSPGSEGAFWLSVGGAIETCIAQASEEVVRHAVARFEAYDLGAKMPEFDELYPKNWMHLQDGSGTCEWLSNAAQRDMTERFLREVRFGIPRESRRWTSLDGTGDGR